MYPYIINLFYFFFFFHISFNLTLLYFRRLDTNQLSGIIPTQLGSLTYLTAL